jgi:septin family protein
MQVAHACAVQETPGLRGDPAECANALCGYMRLEQQRFAKQERSTGTAREDLTDGRVDVVLYFLPINARIREMELDTTVINSVAAYAPVIPVMCRVRMLFMLLRRWARPCAALTRRTQTLFCTLVAPARH